MGRPNRHDPHIRTALGTGQGRRIHQGGAEDVLARSVIEGREPSHDLQLFARDL
jgi:hypothetical protein